MFLWLIFVPHARNVQVDYKNWRTSPELRGIITVRAPRLLLACVSVSHSLALPCLLFIAAHGVNSLWLESPDLHIVGRVGSWVWQEHGRR